MSMTLCQPAFLETANGGSPNRLSPSSWSVASSPKTVYLEPTQLKLPGYIHLRLSEPEQAPTTVPLWLSDESDSCNTSNEGWTPPRSLRKKSAGGKSVNSTVVCLSPHCNSTFKRRADLDRHYKHLHSPESVKDRFVCDYPKCPRRIDPFHRRDHFRDHLREFHKEDIEKRSSGSSPPSSSSSSWKISVSNSTAASAPQANDKAAIGKIATPLVVHTFQNNQAETGFSDYNQPQPSQSAQDLERGWWRCGKCLHRVYFSKAGLHCARCGGRRKGRK